MASMASERPRQPRPTCDGLCVYASEVLPGAKGVAYAHPGCPLHDPGEVCGCGNPDRCLSPTHGQITMTEALRIRHRHEREDEATGRGDDADERYETEYADG